MVVNRGNCDVSLSALTGSDEDEYGDGDESAWQTSERLFQDHLRMFYGEDAVRQIIVRQGTEQAAT